MLVYSIEPILNRLYRAGTWGSRKHVLLFQSPTGTGRGGANNMSGEVVLSVLAEVQRTWV